MVKIKGIFLQNVSETFDAVINKIVTEHDIPREAFFEKATPEMEKLVSMYDTTMINAHLDNHKFSLDAFLANHWKNQKQIVETNSELFEYFIIYVNCCQVIFDKWTKAVKGKRKVQVHKVSIALYGLLVRRAEQIVTSLIDGYVDAAMIMWRSLYENAIALLTLMKQNDEALVDKFLNHSFKNTKKKTDSYVKNHQDLKFKPLSEDLLKSMDEEEQKIIEKYGEKFVRNEYGWADDLFQGKQRASLRLLEEHIKLSRYRPYYIMCSEHVHIGFNGLKDYGTGRRIYLPRITQQNLDKKSFIDPMQYTISILHDVNNMVLDVISIDEEFGINVQLLKEISVRFSNKCKKK